MLPPAENLRCVHEVRACNHKQINIIDMLKELILVLKCCRGFLTFDHCKRSVEAGFVWVAEEVNGEGVILVDVGDMLLPHHL